MNRLAEKVVLVTGGGSGIGRATALLLAAEGARVVVADIEAEVATETAGEIISRGFEALAVVCDISLRSDVEDLIASTLSRFGRIDVLVNSAACFNYKGGFDADPQDWNAVLSVNVAGTATCSRLAAEQMRQSGGGSIVIVSSISGFKADAGYATYCSSKAALLMLTRCLAIDFGEWNIRVNSVCPGPVNTPALRRELQRLKIDEEGFKDHIFQTQCLKQVLQPEDVARGILFFASHDSHMVTGANMVIDGGYSAGR